MLNEKGPRRSMTTLDQGAQAGATNHYRWWILTTALVAQTTAAVSTQGIGVLAGFMQEDLHLTNADVGVLAGVLNIAPILGLLVVGQWLDRAGVRLVIGSGAIVMGLAMVLAEWAHSFGGVLLSLLFIGVGYSTAQPGGSKAVFHWFSVRERGLAMGIRQAGLPLGGAMAAAVFPGIANTMGWRVAFLAGAAIIVAGSALFCVSYRHPKSDGETSQAPVRAQPLSHARTLLTMPEFRQAALSGVTLIAVQTVALMFLLIYLRDRFQIPLVAGALYLLVMQLAGAAGRVLLAAWSDRVRQGRSAIVLVTVIGALLGLIGFGLYPPAWDARPLFAVAAWLGFFGFGWYGPWVAWISEIGPKNSLGATLGLAMSFNQVAIVLAPIAFGTLVDTTAGYPVPGAILVAALVGYIGYSGLRRVKE